jgi:signal transduction histidine kinase
MMSWGKSLCHFASNINFPCFLLSVASPAAIWGEWMSCGPLLLFLTLSYVDKPRLTRQDIFLTLSFFLSIALGFIIILEQPLWLAIIWLIISTVLYLPMFWLVVIARVENKISPDINAAEFQRLSELAMKQRNAAYVLVFIFPVYVVVYFLALADAMDEAMTIVGFQVLSVITKAFFAASVMETHTELLDPSTKALIEQKRKHEARRDFLRHICQVVSTPLNSLALGIDILESSRHLNESERDLLLMMKNASGFMEETLKDVLARRKMEEEKAQLDLAPFSLEEVVGKVFDTFRGSVLAKGITLQKTIDTALPARLLGDRFRIESLLVNLLSNAIKFSPKNGLVSVSVSCKFNSQIPDAMDVTVLVSDRGPGISLEKQKTLFSDVRELHPGEFEDMQESGMGLTLCKQYVTLHGGTISCQSEPGNGCNFIIAIPFQKAALATSRVPRMPSGNIKSNCTDLGVISEVSNEDSSVHPVDAEEFGGEEKTRELISQKRSLNSDVPLSGSKYEFLSVSPKARKDACKALIVDGTYFVFYGMCLSLPYLVSCVMCSPFVPRT